MMLAVDILDFYGADAALVCLDHMIASMLRPPN